MTQLDERDQFAREFALQPEVFRETSITVELNPHAAKEPGNVSGFLLAVNLLARTFERVHVEFPSGAIVHRHPWRLSAIDAIVDELNNSVDGEVLVGAPINSDVSLSFGADPSVLATRQAVVYGTEWRASLDCELPGSGSGTLGCLYAASMGAAQVLLHALDLAGAHYSPMPPFNFSLLDHLPSGNIDLPSAPVTLPESHLVGLGAVGSSAVYALAHQNDIRGTIHLIDNEYVDYSNRKRYPLVRMQTSIARKLKFRATRCWIQACECQRT